MAKLKDTAKWIWIERDRHSEDTYVRARRVFTLRGKPVGARLRIAAAGEYELYVNGKYVGRGPAPSSAHEPLVDVYTEADFKLDRGPNIIAVLAHNYHVGLPRLPRMAAGLWMQLDVTYAAGGTETVATDRAWRMAIAEDFSRRAPRTYWTAGFAEIRDIRREPARWTMVRFADKRWAAADEVKPELPPDSPPLAMRERPTPRLAEAYVAPERLVASGRVATAPGATAMPFEFAMPDAARGEFYAATFVHSKIKQKARLVFDCDEAAAVYVNNHQVPRQGYDEAFAMWLEEEEHDAYTGIHRGQGHRVEAAELTLHDGWNSVGVVVYDPSSAWGFAMRLDDPQTGRPLPVAWSPDMKAGTMAHWHVLREQICPCSDGGLPDTPGPNERTFPDPAYQLAWEVRKPSRRVARGAASLAAGAAGDGPLVLADGEFATYSMGGEVVGYVELEVEGEAGAIVDVVWAESPGSVSPRRRPPARQEARSTADGQAGGDLEPVRRGLRQVDRLILGGGRRTIRFFNRRALAFVELVCRSGEGAVQVHKLGVRTVTAACDPPAVLETEDRQLAAAMKAISRTVTCCMQHTFEGSPAREAEQSLPAAFMLAQAERWLCGRTALGEAALRAFAADQRDDGFFRGIVPSGTVHTVPDWNLLWIIWLAEHTAWSGDRRLAAELYPAAEKCLDWTAQFRGFAGLLENRADLAPWWLFADLSPMDKHGEVTAWQALYGRALHAAADVAEFVGLEDPAAHSRAEADAIVKAARERLWDAKRGLFVDTRLFEHQSAGASAATNYYALYGGLASDEQAARILENLAGGKRDAPDWGPRENPYVKYFALEALLERSMAGRALEMIRSYWGAMADEGLTTVPEVFPIRDPRSRAVRDGRVEGPYGTRPPEVRCHGWGVHPAALMAKWILGVRPGGPGFEQVELAPMPGDLDCAKGRAWTPRGPVDVDITSEGRRRTIRITIPEGLNYRLDRRYLADGDVVEVVGGKSGPE
jgi:alpha-L-rhamnosidase